jgi:NADP-dependent 3-hydroxy acid dehydrogenase YdfG
MVILVTGCRSGFGMLIARSAARAGHVVYAGLRDVTTSGALMEGMDGLELHPIALDVTDAAQREAAVARVLAERGRVDALVNNAGVPLGGFLEQIEPDELQRLFDINVFSLLALTQLVLPTMRAQRSGHVVMIGSAAGLIATPGLGAYAASKFAVEGLGEALRHELAPFGVIVTLVEPGPYRTDIMGRNRVVARRAADPDSPYARRIKKMEALADKADANGGNAQDVADRVLRILGSRNPPLRHVMGTSAKLRFWLKRLAPFRVIELVFAKVTGVPD